MAKYGRLSSPSSSSSSTRNGTTLNQWWRGWSASSKTSSKALRWLEDLWLCFGREEAWMAWIHGCVCPRSRMMALNNVWWRCVPEFTVGSVRNDNICLGVWEVCAPVYANEMRRLAINVCFPGLETRSYHMMVLRSLLRKLLKPHCNVCGRLGSLRTGS